MTPTGITIERDANGVPIVAHIDMREHGDELKEFFISKGIIIEEFSSEPEENSYFTPEMLAEIDLSLQQAKDGTTTKVNGLNELRKFLGDL